MTLIAGYVAPASVSLVGLLMFGNLVRESGVLAPSRRQRSMSWRPDHAAARITDLRFMQADRFVRPETMLIMLVGLLAFIFDSIAESFFAKLLNLF